MLVTGHSLAFWCPKQPKNLQFLGSSLWHLNPEPNNSGLLREKQPKAITYGLFLDYNVFLIEYTGPLFIYFVFYFRMPFIYGLDDRVTSSRHSVVNLACICHSFHYIKRLIETIFVHRFSHGTMPLRNIVKVNCHKIYLQPLYKIQSVERIICLNFCVFFKLIGSKTCKIPYPTKNPFTWLFYFVSCPNYTYEFDLLYIFQCCCRTRMTIFWAKNKHRTYMREFKDYPSLRMSIVPFLL
uniref:3-oxo-5-alpha-steroid 4-dehydrogenase C-terminal domain-containing protein n=1 Tax=Varanus komodoensis TaxID=61221 RepID=A0A8D2J0R2_VARKO